MAINATIQSGIKNFSNDSITNYALFLGGTNVVHDVLQAYDPLKTGYGRLFMVRKPVWVDEYFKSTSKMNNFKHILEYGNTQVQGLNDPIVNFSPINAGYNGKGFEIPTYATDDTNSFTVTCYEFSGSPIREVIHTWINGTTDLMTGLSHYNGVNLDKLQANQTAEFIYVNTDQTGLNVEYACMFANCFPKGINTDVFNYQSGQHELVETAIEFSCVKYESTQINAVAQALINRYRILTNSLNFNSGISTSTLNGGASGNVIKSPYESAYDLTSNKMSDIASLKDLNGADVNINVANMTLPTYSTDTSNPGRVGNGNITTNINAYQMIPHGDVSVK